MINCIQLSIIDLFIFSLESIYIKVILCFALLKTCLLNSMEMNNTQCSRKVKEKSFCFNIINSCDIMSSIKIEQIRMCDCA